MADIRVCDVCAAEGDNGVFSLGNYRQGYPRQIKIDLCRDHRNWAKEQGLNTADAFNKKVMEIILARKLGKANLPAEPMRDRPDPRRG